MEFTLFTVLIGLACLISGTIGGFVFGLTSRLFFRHGFARYCQHTLREAEDKLNADLLSAQSKIDQQLAAAHAEASELYKQAAAAAISADVRVLSPKSRVN